MTADPVELAPHGATWSRKLIAQATQHMAPYLGAGALVWDPCAGIGEHFHKTIGPELGWRTIGSELEPEWALWNPWREDLVPLADDGWPELDALLTTEPGALGTIVADSTTIPARFRQVMSGVFTSWAFDSRHNDTVVGTADYLRHGQDRTRPDGSTYKVEALQEFKTPTGPVVRPRRGNYTAKLGRKLSTGNAAALRGPRWQGVTTELLRRAVYATEPGGFIGMEIKDSLEKSGRRYSLDWLLGRCTDGSLPVRVVACHALDAEGYRDGKNRTKRVAHSQLVIVEVR